MAWSKELEEIARTHDRACTEEARMLAFAVLCKFEATAIRSLGFFQSKKKRDRRRKAAIAREKYKQGKQDRLLKSLQRITPRVLRRLQKRALVDKSIAYSEVLSAIKRREKELKNPSVLIEKQLSHISGNGSVTTRWSGEWFESWIEANVRCPKCGRKLTKLRKGFPEFDLVCTESGNKRESPDDWVAGCGVYVNCKSQQNASGLSWGSRSTASGADAEEAKSVEENKAYFVYGNIYAYKMIQYSQMDKSNRRLLKIFAQDEIDPMVDDISPTVRWNKFGDYKEIRERGSSKWEVVKKPRKKSIPRLELKKIIKMWNKGKIEDLLIMIYDDGYNSKELIKLIAHLREEGHPVKKRRMITISGKLIKV